MRVPDKTSIIGWGVPIFFNIIIIALFIADIVRKMIIPYKYNSFRAHFGSINALPKVLTLIIIVGACAGLQWAWMATAFNRLAIIGLYFVVIFVFLAHYMAHCPFNMCWYSSPSTPDLTGKKIAFLLTGDIQNHYYASDRYGVLWPRMETAKVWRDALNRVKKEWKSTEFKDFELVGVISPGDCSQYNCDGRWFTCNNMGPYEYEWNMHPDDGLLKIPHFETSGNHDYEWDSNIFYSYRTNSVVSMLNRRNKKRPYIVNSDPHGNYSCDFDDLHMIFINVWPAKPERHLITGIPYGSLDFLKSDLKKHGNKKWICVSHWIPFKKNLLDGEDNIKSGLTLPKRRGEEHSGWYDFIQIMKEYGKNCVALLCGHMHVGKSKIDTDVNGIPRIVMGGVAGNKGRFKPEDMEVTVGLWENSTFTTKQLHLWS